MKRRGARCVLCAVLLAACRTPAPFPVGSCLTVGFGAWSGSGARGLAAGETMMPDVRLTASRAEWPGDETWFQAPAVGSRPPVGTPGRDIASMWLAPTTDSLVLLRVGEWSWGLYVGAAWRGDTLQGWADYWEDSLRTSESQARAWGVRHDCSSFGAMGASNAVLGFLDQRQEQLTPHPLPERARRLRSAR